MQFMLMIYNDDALLDALPKGQADAMMRTASSTPMSSARRGA